MIKRTPEFNASFIYVFTKEVSNFVSYTEAEKRKGTLRASKSALISSIAISIAAFDGIPNVDQLPVNENIAPTFTVVKFCSSFLHPATNINAMHVTTNTNFFIL